MAIKVTIIHSTRVRKSENIEIRLEYKRHDSSFIKNIEITDNSLDEEKVKHKTKSNKFQTTLFNYYMLIKSEKKGNVLLDKLLEKAKAKSFKKNL